MRTTDVYDDLFELRNMVDRFFDDVPSRARRREFPYVNIYEGNDEVLVRAIMPGVEADGINIHLVDNSLVIDGEKKIDYSEHPYFRKERLFGTFSKSVRLPYGVDPDNINAEMKNGILSIRLARSEETKPRRIEIK
jgi:HSP20 family protein